MRPDRDEMLMAIARVASLRSTCSRAHVGAVISREGRPISLGYNGAPAGLPHCDHSCDCGGLGSRVFLSKHEGVPGLHYTDCNSEQPCKISTHAEANAIAFAARHGVATSGADLHITFSPCTNCAMLIINSGIIRVRWNESYRISDGIELMQNAGIDAGLMA